MKRIKSKSSRNRRRMGRVEGERRHSSNGAYDWMVTLHGRGSDRDGEVSATTCTRSSSKKSSSSLSSLFLFGRRYDAFLRDGKYIRTVFNGTFLSDHLLRTGYKQDIINVNYLRDMYLIRSLDVVDERMRLYDPPPPTGDSDNGHENDGIDGKIYPLPCDFPNVYYQVDNQQRTLLSREAVIKGMFGYLLPPSEQGEGGEEGQRNIRLPSVTVHIANKERNVMEMNTK